MTPPAYSPKSALLALLLCAGASAAGIEYRPLHGLNDLAGISMTWGQPVADKELRLSTAGKHQSEGAASLHIRGFGSDHKGNQYLGAKIVIPKTDLEAKRLRFDAWTSTPETTNAVYVRYYNTKGTVVGSWNNWSSPFRKGSAQTFALRTGVSRKRFRWEPSSVSGDPCTDVVAIEIIIGTREKNALFDMFVDNVQVSAEAVASAMALREPKKLYLDTRLGRSGKANAVVVCPESDEYRAVASRIAEGVRARSEAVLPVVANLSPDEMAKTNAILLGDLNSNPSVAPLYGHYYAAADALYPGHGGYVARTIHDPWGTGANVVLLGGPTPKEVRAAADEMLKRLQGTREAVVPALLTIKIGQDPTGSLGALKNTPMRNYVEQRLKTARSALKRGAHGGITGMIADAGHRYYRTGHQAYAEAFKQLVYLMYEHVQSKPKTFGGPWGMDADFRLYKMMPAWDLVEESQVFTDEDRLKITRIYAEFIESCVGHAHSVLGSRRLRHNHETFPSLGLMHCGTYFRKYYGADEAEYWLEIADECFHVQSEGSKPYEDCNGYQWLTGYHTIKYVLTRPYPDFFYSSNARRLADYAILCMDNLGYQVPYGDTGSYQCWWTELPYLRAAAWFTGDQRYDWALSKKAAIRPRMGTNEYARSAAGRKPVDLLGTRAVALDRRYYETWPQGAPALNVTVDKVIMRASFDPDRQYLLLDGLSNGGHKHYDGNSISRITDRGRIWLADNEYIKSLPKFHNGVLIFRDGQSEKIPPYCELENVADFGALGFSETVVRDYAGVDWHRNIIWAKEQYFLVIDEMEAKEDNEFAFRALWHTVGEAELTDDGLKVEQNGKQFFIRQAPGPRTRLYDDPELGANWNGYPHAKPVVRVFQQIAKTRLNKGDAYRFFSLLHCSDGEGPLEFEVLPVSNTCVAIRGGGDALAGVGDSSTMAALSEGSSVAAAMFHLRTDGYGLVSATHFDWQGTRLRSDRPVNVEARGGTVEVVADAPTRVEVHGTTAQTQVEGQIQEVERRSSYIVLHGATGKCQIVGVDIALPRVRSAQGLGGGQRPRGGHNAFLGKAIARPPQPKRPHAAVHRQNLGVLWSLKERLSEYLLTNNAGYFESIDTGFTVQCDPAPLAANVFSSAADGSNSLGSLTDGALRTTQGCVMWDSDQPVTIRLDLKDTYELTRIKIKAWWADSSSKGKVFQLDRAVFEASNDDFTKDIRRLGEIVDREQHGNWGAPSYGPQEYELRLGGGSARPVSGLPPSVPPRTGGRDAPGQKDARDRRPTPTIPPSTGGPRGGSVVRSISAQSLRIKLTPRKGTGIYLSELEIWGNKDGLEIDLATQKARGLPVHTFESLHAADVDADGREELVAGSTNGKVYLIGSDGVVRWTFDTGAKVHSVSTARFEPNQVTVISGSHNARVCALAADGKKRWTVDIPTYKRTAVVTTIFPADLDADGLDEVIAGAESWRYYAFDRKGEQLWQYESVRRSTRGLAVDLDGDDKDEVIAGTVYYWWSCIKPDGSRRWSYSSRSGPTATSVAAGDVTGDGIPEIVFGSADTNVHVLDAKGKLLWKYNTGDEVTAVAVCDLNSDSVGEVVAASKSFNVYALKGSGERLWRRDLNDEVVDLAVLNGAGGKRQLAAGTTSGQVYVLDASGKIVAEHCASGDLVGLTAIDLNGDGTDEIVASCADGGIYALSREP